MNLPNRLTMLRIVLIPVFVALLLIDAPQAQLCAAVVFVLAALTDLLDGYIARKRGLVTDFGKLMDPMADKLLVMAALTGLLAQGRAHYVCVLLILGREFVIMSIRLVAAGKGTVIAANWLGKIKTTVQMIAITMLLLPLGGVLELAGQLLIWASAALSIWSCVDYIASNKEVIIP